MLTSPLDLANARQDSPGAWECPDVVPALGPVPVRRLLHHNVEGLAEPAVGVGHGVSPTPLVLPEQVALPIDRDVEKVGLVGVQCPERALQQLLYRQYQLQVPSPGDRYRSR